MGWGAHLHHFAIDNRSMVEVTFLLTHESRKIGNVGICNLKGNGIVVMYFIRSNSS
jgi:hypothetical protein